VTSRQAGAFRALVYAAAGPELRPLPWRETTDPYAILVSEVMLQQTQAERVTERYRAFLARFPSPAALAATDLGDLLTLWQGLGYNRRALALKQAATVLVERHAGTVPDDRQALEALPGIGPYTAGAILAFAFDRAEVFIETNIRSVYLHHFFPDREGVTDRELLPLVAATLDRAAPRPWYNALMDYGSILKRTGANPSRRSRHHQRQSPFAGSNRQQRSLLLRTVLAQPGLTADDLARALAAPREQVGANLARMTAEGLLTCREGRYTVA
jgi:A/G-specific adenine glycosylase